MLCEGKIPPECLEPDAGQAFLIELARHGVVFMERIHPQLD